MIYYLQSCSYPYAGGDERSNEKIRDYLFSKGIFICGCCHYSQGLFREGDTVLMICSNCAEVTLENSPQVKVEGLYSYLANDPDFPWPDYGGEEMVLQDSAGFYEFPQMMADVRTCLTKMNIRVVELPEPERLANCAFDGAKPYAPPSPRKRKMAPLRMGAAAKAVLPVPDGGILPLMEARAPLYTTDRVAVYSWSAGRGVEMAGKTAVHILKLLTRDLP